MITLLNTAERTNSRLYPDNYVYQRHVFAYQAVLEEQLMGRNVLELGCGAGYGMQMLAPYADIYLGVDKKTPQFRNGAVFMQGRLPDLSHISDRLFDTVICFQVIEHIRDDHMLLRQIRRILRPGGTLLLTTPNRLMSLTRNPFHVREYLPTEMTTLLSTYFPDSTVRGIYGNELVMRYYEENRRKVTQLKRLDVLGLQQWLPSWLLKLPYNLFNNLNRLLLLQSMTDVTLGIRHHDFYMDTLHESCLDYFAIARKK